MDRRRFLATSLAAAAATRLPLGPKTSAGPLPILRSVKWGMVGAGESVLEKFLCLKRLGYDGVELVSPLGSLNIEQLRLASQATDLPIHGVVDMVHWNAEYRLSSPDEAARKRGTEALIQAIKDSKALGGDSVLLVPGVVANKDTENHDHVWKRSQDAIAEALPTAARLGVRILIENVWNGFCTDPEQLARYLDEINSPFCGSYFDLGNGLRFAPSERWIDILGPRIVKLDVKDWAQDGGFGKIGAGSADWDAIRERLAKLRFTGWSTAEVQGGDEARLREILANMDRHLVVGASK